jgi:hypothetical protein
MVIDVILKQKARRISDKVINGLIYHFADNDIFLQIECFVRIAGVS